MLNIPSQEERHTLLLSLDKRAAWHVVRLSELLQGPFQLLPFLLSNLPGIAESGLYIAYPHGENLYSLT